MSAQSDDVLIYEVRDGVAWLTLNRPDARNALNHALREALRAAFRRFAADDGRARRDSARRRPRRSAPAPTSRRWRRPSLAIPPPDWIPHLQRDAMVDKPVIAAVHGSALAGGFLLAQMADLCIAARRRAVRHHRGALGPWRAVGGAAAVDDPAARRARAAARRATDSGHVAPTSSASSTGSCRPISSTQSPARSPPRSPPTRRCRSAPASGWSTRSPGCRSPQAFERADELYAPAYLSEDAQEGPRAFRERRAPRWQGR